MHFGHASQIVIAPFLAQSLLPVILGILSQQLGCALVVNFLKLGVFGPLWWQLEGLSGHVIGGALLIHVDAAT
jgi:hypothetical protein